MRVRQTKVVPVANRAWVGSSSPSDTTIDLEAITCCSILISRQPQVKLQFARKEGRLGRLENVINTDNTISLLLCKMAITYRDSLKPGHKLFVFVGFLRRAGIKPDHTAHTDNKDKTVKQNTGWACSLRTNINIFITTLYYTREERLQLFTCVVMQHGCRSWQ